jgi:hypothetical protein
LRQSLKVHRRAIASPKENLGGCKLVQSSGSTNCVSLRITVNLTTHLFLADNLLYRRWSACGRRDVDVIGYYVAPAV